MDGVARLPAQDRADLLNEAAARTGFPASLLEKDFWVCWSLKHLFSAEQLQGELMFKGGTSLSKVFGVIHRFSEDVDLALGWSLIGMNETRPGADLSRTQQGRLWKEMEGKARELIAGPLRAQLKERFSMVLGEPTSWDLSTDPQRPDNLDFRYPESVRERVDYLKPAVVLELGTQAAFTPSGDYTIRPMIAPVVPNVFTDPHCPVRAIQAERTFWEKATILHREFHRPASKAIDLGYSRHYYDVAMMASNPAHKARVLSTLDLLTEVVSHKRLFYPQAWAKYETAAPGSLRLVPGPARFAALRADYANMQVMMYPESNPPDFDWITETLRALQEEINS